MTTPRTLPAADILAMNAALTDLHAAICLVPGDKNADAMVEVFRRYGIYRKDASSFTAREGSNPLTKRGRRIFSLKPGRRKKTAKQKQGRRP